MICIRVVGGRTLRSLVSGLVAVAAVLVGCGGPSEPLGPTATVPQATTTTNPYAVPAVIDEAYVNRVLAGLDEAVGDFVRLVVSTRTLTAEAVDRLEALYIGDHRQIQLDLIAADVDGGLRNYRPSPGNQVTLVSSLIVASPGCIFAKVARDYSEVTVQVYPEASTQWVVLVPARKYVEPSVYNQTGWVFLYDGFQRDGTAPDDPCAKT
jgi:hypothetical protein